MKDLTIHWHSNLPVTFEFSFTPLFPDVVVAADLNKSIGGSTDLVKKGTDRQICIPQFTPLSSRLGFIQQF